MRDFNFKDSDRLSEADITGLPLNEVPPAPRMDETIFTNESEGMRPFHAATDDEDSGHSTAKIVGGVVAGLLIIGGGIYAYEMSKAPAPQTVAMREPMPRNTVREEPANPPAVAPPASASDVTAAPSQTSPDGISTTPSRKEHSSNGTAARPAASAADEAINAPMTLTPQTAPPPEQSAPPGRTALQQPVTAPVLSDQANQSTPEVANNAGANPPSDAAETPAPTPPAQMEESQSGQSAAQQ